MARPRILGALLDVVSAAMAREPEVELDELPRMADFARWTAAAAPALGWDADGLLAAYARNRAAANETTLDASPLVAPAARAGRVRGHRNGAARRSWSRSWATAPRGRRTGRRSPARCPAPCAAWRRTCAGPILRWGSSSTVRATPVGG